MPLPPWNEIEASRLAIDAPVTDTMLKRQRDNVEHRRRLAFSVRFEDFTFQNVAAAPGTTVVAVLPLFIPDLQDYTGGKSIVLRGYTGITAYVAGGTLSLWLAPAADPTNQSTIHTVGLGFSEDVIELTLDPLLTGGLLWFHFTAQYASGTGEPADFTFPSYPWILEF